MDEKYIEKELQDRVLSCFKFVERDEVYTPGDYPNIKGFTAGKTYVILNEIIPDTGKYTLPVQYLVTDDNGRRRQVDHYYFIPLKKEIPYVYEENDVEDVREIHKKYGKVGSSGIPDIIWNWHEMLKDAEEWKFLAGVKNRKQLSIVALNNIEDKVNVLLKAAEEIVNELDSMKYEIKGKE